MIKATRSTVHISAALAALWLTACGGGGGDAAPAPASAGTTAPSPGGTGAPAAATQQLITADTVAAADGNYGVLANGVTVTLPARANILTGQSVTVAASGLTSDFRVAAGKDESIRLGSLASAGNLTLAPELTARTVAPDTTPTPRVWHWVSTNATGDIIVAGEAAGGQLHASTDGGATWKAPTSQGAIWISINMTPSGDHIVAAQFGGGLFESRDQGSTWTPITTTDPGITLTGRQFEGVRVIPGTGGADRMVAVTLTAAAGGAGEINLFNGTTWTTGKFSDGTEVRDSFRAVDASADGQTMIAVAQTGRYYTSTDGGTTWRAGVSPSATDGWYRVKMSADGRTVAMVGNNYSTRGPGTGIYISTDSGSTWTNNYAVDTDFDAIAMSDDGNIIAVTASETANASSRIVMSTNRGATFSVVASGIAETQWRAVALSAGGDKMVAAAGKFDGAPPQNVGQIYTSRGVVSGGSNGSITLQHDGAGLFSVTNSSGAFTLR